MKDNAWRVTVNLTAHQGLYGYGERVEKEFDISAPIEMLKQLEIAGAVSDLYHTVLQEIELLITAEEID